MIMKEERAMYSTVTRAQIAKIWACANELGLERDMLYMLVPRGSISAMTREEAAELIEHLETLRAKRDSSVATPPPSVPQPVDVNAATAEQKSFIHFLFGRLGWLEQPERIRGFLRKYAKVSSVEEIRDRKRASAIIEALKAIHKRAAGRGIGNGV